MNQSKYEWIVLGGAIVVLVLTILYRVWMPEDIHTIEFLKSRYIHFRSRGWLYPYFDAFGYPDGEWGGFIGLQTTF